MDPADFYTGIVIDGYAALRSSTFDAETYAAFVRRHGQPALEVGCGDGHPLLELRGSGLDVDGVDSSADMVRRARAAAAERGLDARVVHQRMEELDLPRRYRSIYLAGPTFTLVPDDETAGRALAALARHLDPAGALLVPLWVPAPTTDLGTTRSATTGPDVEVRYTAVSETRDEGSRTRVTRTRYERIGPDGAESLERDWVVHWHTPDGFARLCDEAGLEVTDLVDDETGGPAEADATTFTATCRRHSTGGGGT